MNEEAVFRYAMKHGPLTVRALADGVGLAADDAWRTVARLVARRLLYRHGEDRAGEALYDWTLLPRGTAE
jgi:hypothetical protein